MAETSRHPRRLRRLRRLMLRFGDALQLSVFWCDLTAARSQELIAKATAIIDPEEDQVLIIPLGPSDGRRVNGIRTLGQALPIVERQAVIV